MAITLNQYNRKVVATFTSNKSINAVKNMVNNKIEPKIDLGITNEFGADLTNLVINHHSKVTDQGNNMYEIYPKTIVSGDFNGTIEQFELRVDNIANAFKTLIGDEINIFGGTLKLNGFHVHRTTGDTDEN